MRSQFYFRLLVLVKLLMNCQVCKFPWKKRKASLQNLTPNLQSRHSNIYPLKQVHIACLKGVH